jgi:hypothetical protein
VDHYAVVTRPCEYQGHVYSKGDHVTSHDVADVLVRLGFADYAASTRRRGGTATKEDS